MNSTTDNRGDGAKKHPCPDCRMCQQCAESRCRLCRGPGPTTELLSLAEQIELYNSLNPELAGRKND